MEKNTEKLLKKFGKIADRENVEVYAVGGFVRDMILKRPCVDIDFVVVGDGPVFAQEVANALKIKNIVIYEQFQTAFIPYKEYKLEFVSARSESYPKNSRKPKVDQADLNSDIMRRDFTINTLAYGLNKNNFGKIIDLLNGKKDIKNKIIKTPLDPSDTFIDDPLRIMRAVRFASQLDFTIEEKTYNAISKTINRLDIISMERIRDEFLKIMASPKPSVGLWLLYNTQILKKIIPELHFLYGIDEIEGQHHKNILAHTFIVTDRIAENSDSIELRLAALFHDIGKLRTKEFKKGKGWTFYNHEFIGSKMIRSIFTRLKLPKAYSKYVTKMVRWHMRPIALTEETVTDSAVRRLLVNGGKDLDNIMMLARADITSRNPKRVSQKRKKFEYVCSRLNEVEQKDKMRAFQSPIRGEEIMKICKLKPGPDVGKIKKQIEEAILEGIIGNDYEEAKKYLKKVILQDV